VLQRLHEDVRLTVQSYQEYVEWRHTYMRLAACY